MSLFNQKIFILPNSNTQGYPTEVWLDHSTNLLWQLDVENRLFTWDEANDYVTEINKINYGGFNNWRLPNIEELEYVYSYKNLDIAWKYKEKNINVSDFAFKFYWSSTLDESSRKAWNICITNAMAGVDKKTDKQCVRLVRDI